MKRTALFLLLTVPMLAPACNAQEYSWENQQYIWVRSNDTVDELAIEVTLGRLISTTEWAGQRLVFVESACTKWADGLKNRKCLESKITLYLTEEHQYEVVGWSEPTDRWFPVRERTVFYSSWTCCND